MLLFNDDWRPQHQYMGYFAIKIKHYVVCDNLIKILLTAIFTMAYLFTAA